MRVMFAILGILLIASGCIVLGTPYMAGFNAPEAALERQAPSPDGRSFKRPAPRRPQHQSWFEHVRTVAEKANAPLSIIFGFMSLYYTRRTYHAQRS